MSHRAKNILIIFLLAVIAELSWMLYSLNYGRYCTPVVKEAIPPADRVKNTAPGPVAPAR